MIFLEGGNYGGIVVIIFMILLGPPVLFGLLGYFYGRKEQKQTSKVFYIIAVVYLVIGLGICGSLVA